MRELAAAILDVLIPDHRPPTMIDPIPCPLFAYYVEGRRRWAPWATESTTVLAPDAYSAAMIAADHHNLRGCKITSVFRR